MARNIVLAGSRMLERMRSPLTTVALACLAACALPRASFRGSFDFALIGDMPYTAEDLARFDRLVRDVNEARPPVEWVVHVGDLRGGHDSPCSDAVLAGRYGIMQHFDVPFVFTPGDNDYLDCRDVDPHERLAYLRRLFFPDPTRTIGPHRMAVEPQSARAGFEDFVENATWTRAGVVFATVHVLAVDRQPDPHPDLTASRNAAAVAWIEAVFARAERSGAPGIFLAMQADPWMVTGPPKATRLLCRGAPGAESPCLAPRGGLEPIYEALERAVRGFGGPVVVATGDLHFFRVDQPLLAASTLPDEDPKTVENLTRVEAFGSPYIHWVRIGVDPRDRDVFSFHPEVIRENRLGDEPGR